MTGLIDSDTIAFAAAASSENESEEIAAYRVEKSFLEILQDAEVSEYKAYLTGTDNFRYKLFPDYKANRKDKARPKHLDVMNKLV